MNVSNVWKIIMLAGALVFPALGQQEGAELSGFRVPFYDETGGMTAQLFGEQAVIGADNKVNITATRVELYQEGEISVTVTTPYCSVDRDTGIVHSDAPVAADMDGIHVQGRGFVLKSKERNVQVLSESRVEIRGLGEDGASATATNDLMVITSKVLFLDEEKQLVRFVESVHVQDDRMTLDSDTLKLRFDENHEIDWIEARGDDCRVEIASVEGDVAGLEAGGSGAAEATVITAQLLYLDQEKQTIRFSDVVHVADPRMAMDCGKLTIHFDESNEIDWIEALSRVTIVNEERKAYAGRVFYDLLKDEFLFEDNPKMFDGLNMLEGEKIRHWPATGRSVCEPAHAVFYTDEKMNTKFFEN